MLMKQYHRQQGTASDNNGQLETLNHTWASGPMFFCWCIFAASFLASSSFPPDCSWEAPEAEPKFVPISNDSFETSVTRLRLANMFSIFCSICGKERQKSM